MSKRISSSRNNSAFKVTSKRAAKASSSVLRDARTSRKSKVAAGSALSQTPSKHARAPRRR